MPPCPNSSPSGQSFAIQLGPGTCSDLLLAPESCQLDTHLGGPPHVLNADPLKWPVNVLHASEEVGRRYTHLGQSGTVGAATRGRGERRDAVHPAGLACEIDRTHVVLEPVPHVAVLGTDVTCDRGA